MGKKYIIEMNDECNSEFKGIMVFGLTQEKQISVELIPEESMTPYTEPDLDAIRNEAYDKAFEDAEQVAESGKKAMYQKGLKDAWDTTRKICDMEWSKRNEVFGTYVYADIIALLSASECIEKIRQYEREKEESEELKKKEQSVTAEAVMRQYLDTFCAHSRCTGCPLNTPDFTCGRGYHFLTHSRISNEEVRRAYAEVCKR